MIEARNVSVFAGTRALLDGASLRVERGELAAIVGPNGAGKTTLLSVLAGDRVPDRGSAHLAGRDLRDWPVDALARVRAVLPQHSQLSFSLTALDVVRLGRTPHRTRGDEVRAAVDALAAASALHLRDRDYQTLSGGEQQRVQLARALAQLDGDDRCLLLDEPTASLDLEHQHAVLATAARLARTGAAVVAVLHDLNLAARYADRVAVLAGGVVLACDAPGAALTPAAIRRAFRVDAYVTTHPLEHTPLVVTAPRRHPKGPDCDAADYR